MDLQIIQNKIYEIRGMRVMLDFDLAEMYGVETKVLKQSVRRNLNRFPNDFMFELSKEEYEILRTQFATSSLEMEDDYNLGSQFATSNLDEDSLRSQFVTLKRGRGQHSKYLPFAFTEQGVAMLASVLNSPKAIEINIAIVRAFVALRQYSLGYAELNRKLEQYIVDNDMRIADILDVLNEMNAEKQKRSVPRNPVGFVKPEK